MGPLLSREALRSRLRLGRRRSCGSLGPGSGLRGLRGRNRLGGGLGSLGGGLLGLSSYLRGLRRSGGLGLSGGLGSLGGGLLGLSGGLRGLRRSGGLGLSGLRSSLRGGLLGLSGPGRLGGSSRLLERLGDTRDLGRMLALMGAVS